MPNQKVNLTKRNNEIYYLRWKEGDKVRWKSTKCDKKSDSILIQKSFKIEEISD